MIKSLLAISVTVLCWGIYGPVLHWGQEEMHHDRLRPFVCVGVAYFLIAVVVPGIYLSMRDEQGSWTVTGTIWSLLAGTVGAIGALGIIMAFNAGAKPIYVMPLVFGGAPVVNSFLTMYMSKTFKQVGSLFFAGLILVIAGAVTVMVFKPSTTGGGAAAAAVEFHFFTVLASILLVVFCWGAYGPVLHKGQMKMAGSRMRPLICVGLAYFVIAVIAPMLMISVQEEAGAFTLKGSAWSLAAGTAGAIGALGIIMAFNFGGKPIFVMPLVFGGAPVVNTFTTMITKETSAPGAIFYAGLILVVVGAAVVLVFAPKGAPPPPAKPPEPSAPPEPSEPNEPEGEAS